MTGFLCALLAALIAALLPVAALAEDGAGWDASREIRCDENLPGCRLLQMVMMGSFDVADPEDAVLERVLACVYPRLCEVTEADIAHFAGEYGEDGDAVRERWYEALANCLRADIEANALPEAHLGAAQRVLLLFLDPGDAPDAQAQRDEIRRELTDAVLRRIAGDVNAPEDFVRWVIETRPEAEG